MLIIFKKDTERVLERQIVLIEFICREFKKKKKRVRIEKSFCSVLSGYFLAFVAVTFQERL